MDDNGLFSESNNTHNNKQRGIVSKKQITVSTYVFFPYFLTEWFEPGENWLCNRRTEARSQWAATKQSSNNNSSSSNNNNQTRRRGTSLAQSAGRRRRAKTPKARLRTKNSRIMGELYQWYQCEKYQNKAIYQKSARWPDLFHSFVSAACL